MAAAPIRADKDGAATSASSLSAELERKQGAASSGQEGHPLRSAAPVRTADDAMIAPSPFEAEFTECFRANYAPLVRTCMFLGADINTAQDVVQEVFSKLYSRWDEFKKVTSPRAYLQVAVRRALIDHHRRYARTQPLAPDDMITLLDAPAPATEATEQAQSILSAMRELPLRQRTVMAWYIDGMSQKEIAEALDMSASTVSVHLHRARQHLKAALTSEVRSE